MNCCANIQNFLIETQKMGVFFKKKVYIFLI